MDDKIKAAVERWTSGLYDGPIVGNRELGRQMCQDSDTLTNAYINDLRAREAEAQERAVLAVKAAAFDVLQSHHATVEFLQCCETGEDDWCVWLCGNGKQCVGHGDTLQLALNAAVEDGQATGVLT